jgi:hypothetical protein
MTLKKNIRTWLYNMIIKLDGTRKISICFISMILVTSFSYRPVYAFIHIHVSPYKPDIIYLGRHNHLEDSGSPSNPDESESQTIFAEVRDVYGKNLHGYLS